MHLMVDLPFKEVRPTLEAMPFMVLRQQLVDLPLLVLDFHFLLFEPNRQVVPLATQYLTMPLFLDSLIAIDLLISFSPTHLPIPPKVAFHFILCFPLPWVEWINH